MAEYYGVKRSFSYLAHYGRPGQKPGQHLPDIQLFDKKKKYDPESRKSIARDMFKEKESGSLQKVKTLSRDKYVANANNTSLTDEQMDRLKKQTQEKIGPRNAAYQRIKNKMNDLIDKRKKNKLQQKYMQIKKRQSNSLY